MSEQVPSNQWRTPWRASGFAVYDAAGELVVHTGITGNRSMSGEQLERMAQMIADVVNRAAQPPAALDRYSIEMEGDICGAVKVEKLDPNGEWVLYEDVAPHLKAASSDLPLARTLRIERIPPDEFARIRAIADQTVAGSTFRKLLWQIEQLEAGVAELIAEPRASSPPAASQWQPIDTAPKDGRKFLAIGMGPMFLCRWASGANIWQDDAGQWREPRLWQHLPEGPTLLPSAYTRTTPPPSSVDIAIARNCLGNLYAAVQRFGPIDADIQFAMREAAQFLGPPYTSETKSEPCCCEGRKLVGVRMPDGSMEDRPCPFCTSDETSGGNS